MFASRLGLAVLRRQWSGPQLVVVGEGLTDHLALTISSPLPVVSTPGTSVASGIFGTWVAGYVVMLALDADAAGRAALQPAAEQARRFGARDVRGVAWPSGCNDACDVLAHRGRNGFMEILDRATAGATS
jgi:DNA primase